MFSAIVFIWKVCIILYTRGCQDNKTIENNSSNEVTSSGRIGITLNLELIVQRLLEQLGGVGGDAYQRFESPYWLRLQGRTNFRTMDLSNEIRTEEN
jgi:hypothetical protein